MTPDATGKPAAAPARRIDELDALRGLAALYVVLFHYTVRYDALFQHGAPLPFTVPYGPSAVDFFFIVSGFVIVMTLERCARWTDFVISRFTRLFPAYWAAITVTSLVVKAFGLPGREVTLGETLANGVMIHHVFGVPDVDGVYWSLEVELFFYACMLGLYLARLLPRIPLVLLVWMGLGPVWARTPAPLPEAVRDLVTRVLVLDHAHLFAAGITFHRWWRRGALAPMDALLLAASLAAARFWGGPMQCFLLGGFFVVFGLVVTGRARLLSLRAPVFLGSISYSLYLTHQNIGYVVMRELARRGAGVGVRIGCALAVALALATGLTFLVERPAMRALRALLRASGPRGRRAAG